MNNEQKQSAPDQKDIIISQVSSAAGGEIAELLQRNARLTVLAAQLQTENKKLKEENDALKAKPKSNDTVVPTVKED
ncbi:hypothetical protein [Levilactobacillus acidifarinae]|uniref:Uncharacterized protein n=1 Tax=Levilactobacillus acidifarinae DSM 19394 = JCM 15949 TaxID=1423715 RepID=A0A0R1LFL6_9LACO|nr:hypothetical protein [Levilactobacillus acidifarinae]KRK94256.1 hypothetical protein FD25_GL000209 [Levilactobacillus acidifarinae DSM 19394]GEO70547.1 hypothetical protein LAC03_24570 [Levilactobacillus acidifarinae]